jgi:serine/threonine protein kinase
LFIFHFYSLLCHQANVLINHRKEACLCDFGLSWFAVDNTLWRTTASQAGGTLRWMAPELFEEESVPTKASDIYAYGMTCYVCSSLFPTVAFPTLCVRKYCLAKSRSNQLGMTLPSCLKSLAGNDRNASSLVTWKKYGPSSLFAVLKMLIVGHQRRIFWHQCDG